MKGLHKLATPLLAFFGVFLAPMSAHADDIEIYYSNPEGGGVANIVMMLDTSGSMDTNECVEYNPPDSTSNTDCVRKGKRLDELKTALYRVIDTVSNNARIGIGVYNQNDGGRLVYPVSNLDAADVSGVAEAFITEEADDGSTVRQSNGSTVFESDWSYTSLPAGIDYRGNITTSGYVGLIFSDIRVPRNARIKSAKLRVMAAGNYGTSSLDYNYYYEVAPTLTDNPDDFVTQVGAAGRTISAAYQGSHSEPWSAVQKYDLDVTQGVQAALQEPTWCGGKDMTLFFTNNSTNSYRYIYLREALNAKEGETTESAPQLIIEWDPSSDPALNGTSTEQDLACQSGIRYGLGSALDDGYAEGLSIDLEDSDAFAGPTSKVGLRFTKIPFDLDDKTVKVNDVIHSAVLSIKGDQNNKDFDLRIAPVYGSTPPFKNTDPKTITDLVTGPAMTYSVAKGDWDQWQKIDVTSIVRDALAYEPSVASDPAGWERRGALGLVITASLDGVPVDMFEEGASSAAYLNISSSTGSLGNILNRVRDKIKERVGAISAFGNTPSMEAYSEMARYYLGEKQRYAFEDVPDRIGMIDGTDIYDSPLAADSCSSNNIVLLTDGFPTNDADYYDAVESQTGRANCNAGYNGTYGSYNCQESLASWLYDGTRNGIGVPITTHTIAFSNDPDIDVLMRGVSAAGGNGVHKKARNATELTAAFEEIINSVTVENATMAAPGVAVNQLNRFRHLDQLYYALFKPSTNNRWEGNLKRYRVSLESNSPQVVDENNLAAVDPNNGFFLETSDSWWGVSVDGGDATAGGAREELAPDARKLYVAVSDLGTGASETASSAPGGGATVLFDEFSDLAATELGLPATASDATRTSLWKSLLNGWGDPLHSQPVLVNYGYSGSIEEALLDPSRQDNTVYVANNDGMLIGLDPKTGKEWFAYMPREEIGKTANRFTNQEVVPPNFKRGTYGLDGGVTVWRRGDGGSGVEHVYAYIAQRRGGNKIFAVDVTDRSNPQPIWSITGGSGNFSKLAQTWSQPALTQVLIDGDKVPVLIFGGGYSAADHDNAGTVSGSDASGNALYIVNAFNGALIWSASDSGADSTNPDMDWSVAAKPATIDYDLDGAVDYIYFSDLGGQVFRVDMNAEASSGSNLAHRVATVARLGTSESGGISNHRRFFAEPVVSLANAYDRIFFQVSIGSGYRPHPLDEKTQDRIYVVNDEDAVNAQGRAKSLSAGFSPSPAAVPGDLLDVTNDLSPSEASLGGTRGWYIDLEQGEKVLAASEVLDGTLFMTTYLPVSKAVDKCTNVIGSARLYVMGVLGGQPKGDFNNDGTIDGRSKDLQLAGLPPAPQLLVSSGTGIGGGDDDGGGDGGGEGSCEGAGKVVLVGTQAFKFECSENDKLQKTRWFEMPDENAATQYLEDNKGLN
jgi:type IV pilus assembly protein PilY1